MGREFPLGGAQGPGVASFSSPVESPAQGWGCLQDLLVTLTFHSARTTPTLSVFYLDNCHTWGTVEAGRQHKTPSSRHAPQGSGAPRFQARPITLPSHVAWLHGSPASSGSEGKN